MVYSLRHILDVLACGLMHIMVILSTRFGGYSLISWHALYMVVSVLMMMIYQYQIHFDSLIYIQWRKEGERKGNCSFLQVGAYKIGDWSLLPFTPGESRELYFPSSWSL
jgi:hypothetical protein